MRRRPVPVLALVVVLAGCGGSNAPSRATYVKNINRVCAQVEEQTNRAGAGNPSTPQEVAAFADRLSQTLDKSVESVANVQRPAGEDGKRAKAYVEALRRQVDSEFKPALADLKAAALKNDRAGVQAAIARIRAIDATKTKNLAKAAGATGCAS